MLITNLSFVSFLQSSLVYGFLFRHKPVYNKYFKQFYTTSKYLFRTGVGKQRPAGQMRPSKSKSSVRSSFQSKI